MKRVVSLAIIVAAACSSGERGLVLGQGPSPDAGNAGDAGASHPPWVIESCSPEITFENRDAQGKGQLFAQAIPDPNELLLRVAHNVCAILYRSASEVKPTSGVTLIVEDFAGVAATSASGIRLSSNHLQVMADQGADLAREIEGVLHFSLTNVYQYDGGGTAPGWLITGIGDYVRHAAGFGDLDSRQPGGSWEDGFRTTAFFLAWIEANHPDFVHATNARLAPMAPMPWTIDAFVDLAGSDVQTLWNEYQAAL